MAIRQADIHSFLQLAQEHPVADVRSPGEFLHAHIPGAFSLPLFTDEERSRVGTAYKQRSREEAIKIGLDFFGPKMKSMVTEVENILREKEDKTILVHCWRGGMRSAAVAWLLDMYGFTVYTLEGGYKAFRNHVLGLLGQMYPLRVLGGYTGSGKTEVLQHLAGKGELVIDLEGLASHRGSAFGNLGLPPQPAAEHFENLLAMELERAMDAVREGRNSCIWMEDESRRIGDVNLPHAFYEKLHAAPCILLEIPFEARLDNIMKIYGGFEKEDLENPIRRIHRRLGGLETQNALRFLGEGDRRECFRILLKYYDKFYFRSSFGEERKAIRLATDKNDPQMIADEIIRISKSL